jgi:hypothetical protein
VTDGGAEVPATLEPGLARRLAYERGVREEAHVAPQVARRRRRVILGVVVLVAAGTAAGILIPGGGPRHSGAPNTAAARTLEGVVTAADNLLANLGAPAPPGLDPATWALSAVPTRHAGSHLSLARAERPWLSPTAQPAPLSAADAARVLAGQSRLLARLFTGSLRRDTEQQLASIVADETRHPPVPSSPGGTKDLVWFSAEVTGNTARAEGQVEEWEQHDSLTRSGGTWHLTANLTTGELDVTAHLVRVGGAWRLTELDQAPYQEAT